MLLRSGRRRLKAKNVLIGYRLIAAAGALLALAVGASQVRTLADSTEPPGTETNTEDDEAQSADIRVRMNFFNASWEHVLRKVAKGTGSELVIEKAPPGRFTRTDLRKYTREEAVRMINREIQNTGFRVLEKGRFLVVMHVDSLRNEYERPKMLPQGQIQHAGMIAEPTATAPRQGPAAVTEISPLPTVVQASHQDYIPEPAPFLQNPMRSGQTPPHAAPADPASSARPIPAENPLRVSTPRRGAREVATIILDGLRRRAEPLQSADLPSFRFHAQRPRDPAETQLAGHSEFTLAVDEQRQELVIDGDANVQQAVSLLIREVDAAQTGPEGVIRLVASEGDPTKIRRAIEPTLRLMSAQLDPRVANRWPRQGGNPPRPLELAQLQPGAFQPAPLNAQQPPEQPQANQPPPEGAATPQGESLIRMEGLQGPVEIRDVPGIGMVIIGNPNDVATVTQIIQQLELVAARAEAVIHLLNLRNVSSEALAALLTEVYAQLNTIRTLGANQNPRAAIIPVIRPNAVLILAPKDELPAILDLADKLDQPSDPQTELEVFPLRSAIASEVLTRINEIYPQQAAAGGAGQQGGGASGGLLPRPRLTADVRTNTIIVQAAPRDLQAVGRLIRELDRDSSAAVSRVQVFPLRNAVAEELAEVINNSIQSVVNPPQVSQQGGGQFGGQFGGQGGGGQNTQALREVKSTVLEFLMADGEGQRIVRSGILADIRVTADTRANSLIVTAPEASMFLMAELIHQLDQPTSNVAVIKVFTLRNGDAAQVVTLLQELFTTTNQQGQQGGQVGLQVVGAEDASSGLIPMRFSYDTRTNSVLATGGAEAVRVVEAVILTLDGAPGNQRSTQVIKLKNSPAQDVSDAINQFLQSQRDLATLDPELISNVDLLEQEIIVVPEVVSNSLLVSVTPRYYQQIMDIINRIDSPLPQVVIQALIVEVSLQNSDEFGVELGFQDSVLFDRGLVNPDSLVTLTESVSDPSTGIVTTTQRVLSQEKLPGFLFNNQQLGNNSSVHPSKVGTQGLSNFSLGRVNGDLGFGGLVLSASSDSVSALIRALAARRDVQILSRPQIRTLDNQLGYIFVGQEVPRISSVATNTVTGAIQPVVGTPAQVGIGLSVTPRITTDGMIVMEVIANKSRLTGQGVPLAIDPATGNVIEAPIFDLTQAQTTVSVPDGQTVVIGGMITKTDDTLERKVPWLGDIPIIGTAFRYDSTSTIRTELLVFLTPRILRSDADSELIKQIEVERTHFLVKEAEAIHGPLFAVPAEEAYGVEADGFCPPSVMEGTFQQELVPTPATAAPIQGDVLPPPISSIPR